MHGISTNETLNWRYLTQISTHDSMTFFCQQKLSYFLFHSQQTVVLFHQYSNIHRNKHKVNIVFTDNVAPATEASSG